MKKYQICKIIAITGIISANLLAGCGALTPPDADAPRPPTEITEGRPPANIIVTGVVESAERRVVYTTLGFTVEHIHVEVGDYVTAGQLLATLDSADLDLTIAAQKAALNTARQSSQNAVADSERMLNEATANLANNTNVQIINAQSALNAATANFETLQRQYNDAVRDFNEGNDLQVLNAESILRAARLELGTREREHETLTRLAAIGASSQEELRQSEDALTHTRNQYHNARTNYDNAVLLQQRSLDQLRLSLQSAETAQRNAREMLNASRTSANQEIEMLRSNHAAAQAAADLEHMEIGIRQLQRQLEDSKITAPINGTVTAVIAREGAIGTGQLFVIEDTDNLRIITRFREYDLSRVETGIEVSITSDATGTDIYSGVITRINPAAAAHSNIVEFETEIKVVSENTGLRIGMNTRLNVVLE